MSRNSYYGHYCNIIKWAIYYKLIGKHTVESYRNVVKSCVTNIEIICQRGIDPKDVTVEYNGLLYTI